MLETTDPRIHFTLCMHNKSSPKIRIFSPHTLEVYMEAASFDYCEREIKISARDVTLPMIFYWYQTDFLGEGEGGGSGEEEGREGRSGGGESGEEEGVGEGGGKRKYPLAIIRWLTQRQASKLGRMVAEGNYQVSYSWDWTPNPSPL
jgi:hypothetical protein